MNEILEEFDAIIEEAPVDFLGTGSDSRHADKEEREWRDRIAALREKLVALIETRN